MTHDELKDWFQKWLSKQDDVPIPLVINKSVHSTDIRVAIEVNILRIEEIAPEERKANKLLVTYKHRLVEIKDAIEVGNHDIRPFGYKNKNSNYIPK